MKQVTWAVVALALACAGCASEPVASTSEVAVVPVYHLAPDDRLKISVYGEPDLTGEFLVGSDGNVSFPLIGMINANGLTLAELQAKISQVLATRYLKDPKVTADVVGYRPFYVLGEVNKAGQYPYRAGLTVNAAVATAGGFTYRANHRAIAIQRYGTTGEQRYRLTADLQVGPGDTIRVLERFF